MALVCWCAGVGAGVFVLHSFRWAHFGSRASSVCRYKIVYCVRAFALMSMCARIFMGQFVFRGCLCASPAYLRAASCAPPYAAYLRTLCHQTAMMLIFICFRAAHPTQEDGGRRTRPLNNNSHTLAHSATCRPTGLRRTLRPGRRELALRTPGTPLLRRLVDRLHTRRPGPRLTLPPPTTPSLNSGGGVTSSPRVLFVSSVPRVPPCCTRAGPIPAPRSCAFPFGPRLQSPALIVAVA